MANGITQNVLGLTRERHIPSAVTTGAHKTGSVLKFAAPVLAAVTIGVLADRWIDQRTSGPGELKDSSRAAWTGLAAGTAACTMGWAGACIFDGQKLAGRKILAIGALTLALSGAALINNAISD